MTTSSRRPPPDSERPVVTLADLPEARALYAQLDPAWFDEANDPERWLAEPEVQALLAEVVAEGTAPFVASLAPDEARALVQEVTLACQTDPTALEYLKRVRPRPPQDDSGKVRKGMFDAPPAPRAVAKKAGGQGT